MIVCYEILCHFAADRFRFFREAVFYIGLLQKHISAVPLIHQNVFYVCLTPFRFSRGGQYAVAFEIVFDLVKAPTVQIHLIDLTNTLRFFLDDFGFAVLALL